MRNSGTDTRARLADSATRLSVAGLVPGVTVNFTEVWPAGIRIEAGETEALLLSETDRLMVLSR